MIIDDMDTSLFKGEPFKSIQEMSVILQVKTETHEYELIIRADSIMLTSELTNIKGIKKDD